MNLLLQARIRCCNSQSRCSALRHTVRVCLSGSRLRVPVSRHGCTLSSLDRARDPEQVEGQRTFMNMRARKFIGVFPVTQLFKRPISPRRSWNDSWHMRILMMCHDKTLFLQPRICTTIANWTPCRAKRMMIHRMIQWSRCIILTGRTGPWLRYFPPIRLPSTTPTILTTS
jgi:hypothetical protein